ncbi:MAG TPA: hypothetical protein VM432_07710, partial [Bdellovibrionales bacterium]|nr:hypothetical protein [Bdellovibrionales bacterium]
VEGAGFNVASLGWAAMTASTANATEAKADGVACKDCGKEGHTCEHCSGKKGEKHTCSEGSECKGDCPECKKAGHKHGKGHKHDDKKKDDHAGH